MKVSVRELKNGLSRHLRTVKAGRSIVITSHNKPVAQLSPARDEAATGIRRLIADGYATWNGKKPRGLAKRKPIKLRGPGPSISDMVLDERR
jgi:prevent-host-death family protein